MNNDNSQNKEDNLSKPATETPSKPTETALPSALNSKFLEEKFKDRAGEIYEQVCRIGGFGDFGADFHNGLPSLDLSGITDKGKREQIAALLK